MATAIKTRTVGVLLYPELEPLDVFGPVEAFTIAEWPGAKPEDPRPFRVVTVTQAGHAGGHAWRRSRGPGPRYRRLPSA